jgi:MFS transporter, ACS family, glucarate transporter
MTPVAESVPPTGADVRQAWRLVALLALVASTGYLCRVNITVVAPRLMAEFCLSQAQMGQIFSAFLLGYTVFQAPSGWIADRVKTRPLFLSLTLGWGLLTAATTFVGRLGLALGALPALLLLRTAFGIVAAPMYPAAGRAIAVSVAPPLHGRSNGAVLASIGVGSAVAPPLLGFATARWGWRPALLLCAAIAALVAVIWRVFAPDVGTSPSHFLPPAGRGYSSCSGATGKGATLRSEHHVGNAPASRERPSYRASPFRQRSFWFLVASYLLQGYVGYVFVFWFYL